MSTQPPLSALQQAVIDAVVAYPGRFSRSGLAKMLVGAKSWQETGFPEYGRFAQHRRRDVGTQVAILVQQGRLRLDGRGCLLPVATPDHD